MFGPGISLMVMDIPSQSVAKLKKMTTVSLQERVGEYLLHIYTSYGRVAESLFKEVQLSASINRLCVCGLI